MIGPGDEVEEVEEVEVSERLVAQARTSGEDE
jgi:hypothetical protein